jgi:uncharacterized membrane protein (DUF4010 family)
MSELELLQRTALAAAIGLLVGIERGWQEREARDGARVGGIRTFTLIGTLGAISSLFSGPGGVALGLCFLAFALPFSLFEWRRAVQERSVSATDLVAGLLTFALGAYAARGNMAVAAATGVASAAILAERRVMHEFLRRLKWTELRAALMLLVMTAVLLPVLPDRTVDPWNAINPHQIWLMTVLVGTISYAGYIAVRLAGERRGLLAAGLLGGLVSSTTVTWTYARLARRDAGALPALMSAILGSWVVSLLRMIAVVLVIQPALAVPLAPPILTAAVLLSLIALAAWRRSAKVENHALVLQDPLDLELMLGLTALLTIIMLLSKLWSSANSGLFTLGGASGLLDVDPITLSMAKLAGTSVAATTAVSTILIAAAANGVAKALMALTFGGPRLGFMLGISALAAFGVGIATYTYLTVY